MSARFGGPRPVIREVRPDNYANISNISNIAPSSPSTSPKVRFAATSSGKPIAGVSRPLKRVEASSLKYFEDHARQCEVCRYLASSHRSSSHRSSLCSLGHSLALDVACHVQYLNGDICSRERESESNDYARVEVPHDYVMLRQLLKNMDRGARRQHRTAAPAPIVSYDPPMYSARRPSYDDLDLGRVEAIIEPSHSSSHRRRHRSRYSTVAVVDDDDDDHELVGVRPTYKDRRGTLYEKDAQRKREAYRVEIHEPRSSKRSSGWP